MNALDRMKRLVGLEGGSSSQHTPVALGTSSKNGPAVVKMTNSIGDGANSREQRQLVGEPPLTLDLALTTSAFNLAPSENRQPCDHPTHSAQPNQPLCQPLRDYSPAIGHDAEPPSLPDSCAAIIEGAGSSSSSKAPYTRGHRRRSTHVTHRDLEKFQKEVLGVDNRPAWYDEENGSSVPINPYDPQLSELNLAFERADMSMNSGAGGMAGGNNPGPNMYSNFTENSPTSNMGSMQRQSPNPAYPHPAPPVNGGGAGAGGMVAAMNASMPMNAGHQMDLHHLYEMVMELSEVLKNNREVTKSIVTSAEEIMKHGNSEDASAVMRQVNGEISAARISELERALAKEKRLVEDLRREQVENTKLIGEYEASVGTMVEQIRNYCQNNNLHFLYQKSHYNNLLQAERDAHLESRLDRDYWHTQTMKCAQMIRNAHRIRSNEEEVPIRIIAGLQNEVRAYRNALGMEPEKPEEEYGWEILKDVPSPE
ncbi:hypothetical protein PMG11_03673 [Penicillium brasilianum]|uniref:Uncharacterized protein n=1 Tax=Penicillium brasilianum TaxID=104259 RepID=A0A0F7VE43_PENBI|nr:hypothetical protein PMG11_03673 [Penicillium brasilianum]